MQYNIVSFVMNMALELSTILRSGHKIFFLFIKLEALNDVISSEVTVSYVLVYLKKLTCVPFYFTSFGLMEVILGYHSITTLNINVQIGIFREISDQNSLEKIKFLLHIKRVSTLCIHKDHTSGTLKSR